MAVPKRRKSKSKTRMGRSNKGLSRVAYVRCHHCGSATLPHRVCPACGVYAGRSYATDEAAG